MPEKDVKNYCGENMTYCGESVAEGMSPRRERGRRNVPAARAWQKEHPRGESVAEGMSPRQERGRRNVPAAGAKEKR
ncbi:MAG: hypothetical protein ACI4DU_00240 [Lachnospiraceae bacterium]